MSLKRLKFVAVLTKVKNLSILLRYFEELYKIVDNHFPEEITWENCKTYNFKLDYKHPKWVNDSFPLTLIYWKPVAGKLRDSKSWKVMYQNNQNVLSQLVWTANQFGMYYRKNKHKGFSNIVAAVNAEEGELINMYPDRQKLKKYKNFKEFRMIHAPKSLHIKALCEVLEENYPCDSRGQLRMF